MAAKAAFNAGVLAFRDAKYNEAVEKFSEAISFGAQSHIVLDSRAAAYEKLGRYKEALLDSRRVIEQFPDLSHGYSRASRLLTILGKHDKAVALAQKGIAQVKPNDPKSSTMQALLEAALLAQHAHEQELKAKECHVTKLPVELLAQVFGDVVQRHRTSPAALAHVCHQWRDLALNMSSLWRRLVLDHKGNKQEARTAFWLRHSRGRIRQLRVTTSKNFSECMSQLAGNASSHLEEIDFEFITSESVPPYFRFQADPISFSWSVRGSLNDTIRRLPFEPKMGPFRISELRIIGVDLYWQIEAQQLENLTTLVVENGNLVVSDLLVILDRSPNIQTLEVQTGYESPLPERKERLVLANLNTLKLLFSNTLLQFIEVPALQALRFVAVQLGKALQDLSPPQPPLVSFSALECTTPPDAIFPLPDTLKTLLLTSLAYNVDKVVDSLVEGKCPRLIELNLSNTGIGSGPIIRLIKARNCLATGEDEGLSKTAKLELLIMDRCDGISTDSLPWIRSKVPRARRRVGMAQVEQLELGDNTMSDLQMTTPEKSTQTSPLVSTSTPSIARATGTLQYSSGSGAKAREAVRQDVGAVDVVSLQSLLHGALPVVQDEEVESILTVLKQSNVLSADGWEHFQGNKGNQTDAYGPQHCQGTEDQVFRRVEDIYRAIMIAAGGKGDDSTRPALALLVHINENPTTDWPSSTRPDATLHLAESSVPFIARTGERYRVDHADVVMYFQWKKRDTESNLHDDSIKLIHNVHHRFLSDPCVTHVTGITIENTSTRFWYFDRSVILPSHPFDFMTEPQHLVHIFLALVRGSRSELGFDTTIRCVGFEPAIGRISEAQSPESLERQYEFEVHDNQDNPNDNSPDRKTTKRYRSVNCIADYGRIGIRGRGTSIYSVRPSDDGDAPLQVLKDSWINVDRITEGRVLDDIHATLQSDAEYRQYLQHFLRPDCHGFVPNDAGTRIETLSLSGWSTEPSSSHSIQPNVGRGKKRKLDSIQGGPPQVDMAGHTAKIRLRGDAKKRIRTVFVEGPGKELGVLETLGEVFTAIKGGLSAMLAMYRAGYIHRDLSVGNIILLSRKSNQSGHDEDVGVLIDLEYAKKFPYNATKPRDVRTLRGTWEFVASEVRIGRYLYSLGSSPEERAVPWFRNPVHDLESCWLLACWSFFYFKHPELLSKDMEDKTLLFGPLRPLLGFASPPLGRLPRDFHPIVRAWALLIGDSYRKLQLHRREKEKLDSFDYEPAIRNAIFHVEEMIRISIENYSTSWNLHSPRQELDTRPTKRIKIDGPSAIGT